jgi:hypothetical protein
MTAERFDAILNLADKIRSISTDGSYPVDVNLIVAKLGGVFFFKKEKESGADQYNSTIKITEPHKFEVLMLSLDEKKDLFNRFEIARCLGYLFLHTKYVDGGSPEVCIVDQRSILSPRDVDVFAMGLLMPKDHFLEIAEKNMIRSKYNVEMLSYYFKVPAYFVRNYGHYLGSYRWNKDA